MPETGLMAPSRRLLRQVQARRRSGAECPVRLFEATRPRPVASGLKVVSHVLPATRVQADRVSSPISTAADTGAEACATGGGRWRVTPVRLSGSVFLSTVGRDVQVCRSYYSTLCKHLFDSRGFRRPRKSAVNRAWNGPPYRSRPKPGLWRVRESIK